MRLSEAQKLALFVESRVQIKVLAAIAWGVPIFMLVPWVVLTHRRLSLFHLEKREEFFNTTCTSLNSFGVKITFSAGVEIQRVYSVDEIVAQRERLRRDFRHLSAPAGHACHQFFDPAKYRCVTGSKEQHLNLTLV